MSHHRSTRHILRAAAAAVLAATGAAVLDSPAALAQPSAGRPPASTTATSIPAGTDLQGQVNNHVRAHGGIPTPNCPPAAACTRTRASTAGGSLRQLVTEEDITAATAAAYGDTGTDEQHRRMIRAALEAYGPRLLARLAAEDDPSSAWALNRTGI
jgi:hypothetical protein